MFGRHARRCALVACCLAATGAADARGATVQIGCDEPIDRGERCSVPALEVRAKAGERNSLSLFSEPGAITVRDAGAPLTAGRGCVAAAVIVRCAVPLATASDARGEPYPVRVQAGDGDDAVYTGGLELGGPLVDVWVEGGAGDDTLVAGDIVVPPGRDLYPTPLLEGGKGEDVLVGGKQADILDGGAGDDALVGLGGDDRLNGDPEDVLGDDLLDGGDGRDTAGYEDRSRRLTVDLADPGPDGSPGERDRLVSIEDVVGGSGDAVLRGDDGPNRITGVFGGLGTRSRVIGLGGDDRLTGTIVDGGPGDDTLSAYAGASCGPGRDRFYDPLYLATPIRGCEVINLRGVLVDLASVKVGRATVSLRGELLDERAGTLRLRIGRRVLARRRMAQTHAEQTVTFRLGTRARRLLRRKRRSLVVVYDVRGGALPTRGFRVFKRRAARTR